MGAALDKFMTIEEVPEEWRSLDVTVGGLTGAGAAGCCVTGHPSRGEPAAPSRGPG